MIVVEWEETERSRGGPTTSKTFTKDFEELSDAKRFAAAVRSNAWTAKGGVYIFWDGAKIAHYSEGELLEEWNR